jgi:hypothetical protein
MTNDRAEMLLDNHWYRFEAGSIFLFNHGCVHSASNHGSAYRFHLSWDMLLTRETFELMFAAAEDTVPAFLARVPAAEQAVHSHRKEVIRDFETQGRGRALYDRLRLRKLHIRPSAFQGWFNEWAYLRQQRRSIAFARLVDE